MLEGEKIGIVYYYKKKEKKEKKRKRNDHKRSWIYDF